MADSPRELFPIQMNWKATNGPMPQASSLNPELETIPEPTPEELAQIEEGKVKATGTPAKN